jgi:hypothetical protein
MNKIDKLLEKVNKFEKIAKNLKFAQTAMPDDQLEKMHNLREKAMFILNKYLLTNPNPGIQQKTNTLSSSTDPNQFEVIIKAILPQIRNTNIFSGLNSIADQLDAVDMSTVDPASLPDAPSSKPKQNAVSFTQKINDKVSTLNNASNKLLESKIFDTNFGSKPETAQKIQYIDTLVTSLAQDRAMLDKGQADVGTPFARNQGYLSGLSGELVDATISKINNAFLKAVDAKTQAIAAGFKGPTGVDIKKLLGRS